MTKKFHTLLFAGALLLSACEEEAPFIKLVDDPKPAVDTTFILPVAETPQAKNVLIEDFTGVRCGNCPKGHEAIEALVADHGSRMVPIATHGYDFPQFTSPYSGFDDFRTTFAAQIYDIIGKPAGLPFASFDRTEFSSNTSGWIAAAENRMNTITPKANLSITNNQLDEAGKKFTALYRVSFCDSLNEDVFISIAFLESHIISKQLDDHAGGTVDNYEHNHVLRTYPIFASKLNDALPVEKGRTWEKQFTFDAATVKNFNNGYAVLIVHKAKDILQVMQVKMK